MQKTLQQTIDQCVCLEALWRHWDKVGMIKKHDPANPETKRFAYRYRVSGETQLGRTGKTVYCELAFTDHHDLYYFHVRQPPFRIYQIWPWGSTTGIGAVRPDEVDVSLWLHNVASFTLQGADASANWHYDEVGKLRLGHVQLYDPTGNPVSSQPIPQDGWWMDPLSYLEDLIATAHFLPMTLFLRQARDRPSSVLWEFPYNGDEMPVNRLLDSYQLHGEAT